MATTDAPDEVYEAMYRCDESGCDKPMVTYGVRGQWCADHAFREDEDYG